MAKDLSERQKKILQFIQEFIDENQYPPTIREIGKDVGISSTSVVKYNLDVLARRDLIERNPDISRGIRLVGDLSERVAGVTDRISEAAERMTDVFQVPVLGRIAAGSPIPVPEAEFSPFGYERSVELTRDIVKDQKGIYALEVQGDSMIDALINDGDIVLMRHQERVENGELAAVWLQDQEETTLKRFYLEGARVRLQPANPTMQAMYFPAENVQVMGKVVCVIRQMN
ncbi:MAG: transcriptional repressor LexA [Anaerolineae bacterium]|jgi:repressor LexA